MVDQTGGRFHRTHIWDASLHSFGLNSWDRFAKHCQQGANTLQLLSVPDSFLLYSAAQSSASSKGKRRRDGGYHKANTEPGLNGAESLETGVSRHYGGVFYQAAGIQNRRNNVKTTDKQQGRWRRKAPLTRNCFGRAGCTLPTGIIGKSHSAPRRIRHEEKGLPDVGVACSRICFNQFSHFWIRHRI